MFFIRGTSLSRSDRLSNVLGVTDLVRDENSIINYNLLFFYVFFPIVTTSFNPTIPTLDL